MRAILDLIERDEEDEGEFSFPLEIKRLACAEGWESILAAAFDILGDRTLQRYWGGAIQVVYFAEADPAALPYPISECVARLYHCIATNAALRDTGMDNVVWSTVRHWLGKLYDSNWNPYDDPVIRARIEDMGAHRPASDRGSTSS